MAGGGFVTVCPGISASCPACGAKRLGRRSPAGPAATRSARPHPPNPNPPCPQCGVGHLARVLNTLLVEHIRGLLPSLRQRIEEAVASRRRELAMYGDAPPGASSAARGALLLTILDSYASRFRWARACGRGEQLGRARQPLQVSIFVAGGNARSEKVQLSEESCPGA